MADPIQIQGPSGRNPDYGTGEYNFVKVKGAGTGQVAAGGGYLHSVVTGVAGTLLIAYDALATGTLDDTTKIATVDLASVANGTVHDVGAAFSTGLTIVVTGTSAEFVMTGRWGHRQKRVLRRAPA